MPFFCCSCSSLSISTEQWCSYRQHCRLVQRICSPLLSCFSSSSCHLPNLDISYLAHKCSHTVHLTLPRELNQFTIYAGLCTDADCGVSCSRHGKMLKDSVCTESFQYFLLHTM